ncbi:MAG TPA: MBL fold metallo-hydrolase, partial [Methylibium sp.]
MFIVGNDGVIACDAPPTLGLSYPAAIAEVTPLPVTHLIYSHEHVDHIGASTVFPAGIEIIASQATARLLRERNDPLRRLPTRTFQDRLDVTISGQRLELAHRGANHSVDNSFIYAPRQKVLMFVDVIYPGWVPYKNLGVAVDIPGFVAAHRQALAYPFKTMVAGHVSRPGTRADVLIQMELLRDLADAARRAYESLSFADFLAANPPAAGQTAWDRHNDYEQLLVDKMANALLSAWSTRLQGAATYLRDNCWAMLESFVVQGRPNPQAL